MQRQKVVIIGAGFAGVRTALQLAKINNLEVVLISNNKHFEYYPGLHKLLGVHHHQVVSVPLTDIFQGRSVEILIDTVTTIDPKNKQVTTLGQGIIVADYVVVACGSQTEYFNIEGLEEMAYGFKSVADATNLRAHIESMFEKHGHADKAESVVGLHMIVVGGGPNGVDLAGELAVFTKKLAQQYHVVDSLITIDLIEGNDRVLAMLPESVSHHVEKRLRKLGVTLLLNRELEKQGSWTVTLKDMTLGAKTLIWTAGVRANDLVKSVTGATLGKRNRISVDDYLQINTFANVFVIGDAADTKYSGLAQTALSDADYIVSVIKAKIAGNPLRTYVPKPNAFNIGVGPRWSVMMVGSFVSYGIFPYIIRTLIDIKFFLSILPVGKVWKLYRK